MNNIEWIRTQGDASLLFTILIIMVLASVVSMVGAYYYKRWASHRRFLKELEQLSLTDSEQDAFSSLVIRHAKEEPINVLYSLPVFDRIAEKELHRVLASNATQEAKEKFVELVYTIRSKTYFALDEEQVVA